MPRRAIQSLWLFWTVIAAAPVFADTTEDLAVVRQNLKYGNYEEAMQRAEHVLDAPGLSVPLRVDLHRLAGAAAFNLKEKRTASRHFSAMLRLQPDTRLDPFEFQPPMVSFFEDVRKKLEPELALIRLQPKTEALPPTAVAAPPKASGASPKLESPTVPTAVSLVPRDPGLAYHFLPFGIPQLRQGRRTAGIVFGAGQGAAALTSLVTLVSYYAAASKRLTDVNGELVTEWGLSPRLKGAIDTTRMVNLISSIAFYVLYVSGVADALFHRDAQTPGVTLAPSSNGPVLGLSWGDGK
ncbi:MAG: hypothetical protein ACT4TC_11280 [Myxococcaceae bacterium]